MNFIALMLPYNMRLERSFSIKQFQSYRLVKISAFQHMNLDNKVLIMHTNE